LEKLDLATSRHCRQVRCSDHRANLFTMDLTIQRPELFSNFGPRQEAPTPSYISSHIFTSNKSPSPLTQEWHTSKGSTKRNGYGDYNYDSTHRYNEETGQTPYSPSRNLQTPSSFGTPSRSHSQGDSKSFLLKAQAPPTDSIYDLTKETLTLSSKLSSYSSFNEAATVTPSTLKTTPVHSVTSKSKSPHEEDPIFPKEQPLSMETTDAITDTPLPLPTTSRHTTGTPSESSQQQDQWVTVFGFPSNDVSTILQFFRSCGTILKVKYGPNNANWAHIQFKTKLQAQRALQKNGKIINGNIMVGVIPCTDKTVVKAESEEIRETTQESTKPLAKSYRPVVSEYSVEPLWPKDAPTPHRSFCSKLVEYVFGI
jgi:nuclear pore complex protein Nup53